MLYLIPPTFISYHDVPTRQAALEGITVLSGVEHIRNTLGELGAISVIKRSADLAHNGPFDNKAFLIDLSILCLHSMSAFNLGSIPTDSYLMERYYLGPHTTVQRLLSLVIGPHVAISNCQIQTAIQYSLSNSVVVIAFNSCSSCGGAIWENQNPLSATSRDLLARLVKLIRYGLVITDGFGF